MVLFTVVLRNSSSAVKFHYDRPLSVCKLVVAVAVCELYIYVAHVSLRYSCSDILQRLSSSSSSSSSSPPHLSCVFIDVRRNHHHHVAETTVLYKYKGISIMILTMIIIYYSHPTYLFIQVQRYHPRHPRHHHHNIFEKYKGISIMIITMIITSPNLPFYTSTKVLSSPSSSSSP